ncbi:serine-rich adhesin for platelets [Procambarus clarkii]|uniref:serine-rich adhesin for platelets n=1 Tax=Procambarus clarkii TaxID=6728 RepID=UPI001E676189|nr:uncharacterized protein LOC123774794 isoform X2 [Procambarus clarkii]
MGKKCKKKVQWRQLSLNELQPGSSEQEGDECEEDDGEGGERTPPHDAASPHARYPYPRPPPPPYPPHFQRRGAPHQGYYYRNFDKRFDKNFDRRGGFDRFANENLRNFENRGPYSKPPFFERPYYYDNKFYGRPPYCPDRNFKFGFVERGRRPFRPYGRHGFFHRGFPGHFPGGVHPKDFNGFGGPEEEEEEDWEELPTDELGVEAGDRPSQPVHTVMINNEEYTKIQTPRQEVIFKKSSLDRKQDSLDQASLTGSMTSGSGSCSTGDGGPGSPGGSGDQLAGDQVSLSGSMEDNSLSVGGDDPSDGPHHDAVFEDPNDMFVSEGGGPPLAGVVMQQAYPGGPMFTIPVHWTPFIDPALIPGETALTPLDPAFTHVIDPKSLPIDPLHILPVQHDATGCPVQVQVKVDSNGVPIQIEPSAFTVSLSSLQHGQPEPRSHTDPEPHPGHTHGHLKTKRQKSKKEKSVNGDPQERCKKGRVGQQSEGETIENSGEVEDQQDKGVMQVEEGKEDGEVDQACYPASSVCEEVAADGPRVRGKGAPGQLAGPPDQPHTEARETVLGSPRGDRVGELTGVLRTHHQEMKPVDEDEEEEEEDEEEEEEDMLTKESEEGSDSSDSQYASMSESSTTPTTPEGEPSDAHETPAPTLITPTILPSVLATPTISPTTPTLLPSASAAPLVSPAITDTPSIAISVSATPTTPLTTPPTMSATPTTETSTETDSVTSPRPPLPTSTDSPKCSESTDSSLIDSQEAVEEVVNSQVTDSQAVDKQAIANQVIDSHMTASEVTVDSAVGERREKESQSTESQTTETGATETEATETEARETEARETEATETEGTSSSNNSSSTQANILQGYVMVPILTPYYDPSVLYGYPVVVASQQQQQQQQLHHQPPPPHQHCYGKRKKKKYQRRRHADASTGESYLDPQLYTGEPFVATPGGYVVPIEAAASVCQVHGLQYVTPAFHQHLPDEGFVSVQHSPYLPEVAPEPPPVEVQQSEDASQEDASKTVFSDLQDKERRQIEEILHERAKADKSDSTESSDSGVSESEEVAATELSCDELETCKKQTSQATNPNVGDSTEEHTGVNASTLPYSAEEHIDVNASTLPYSTEEHTDANAITLPCQVGISTNGLERLTPETASHGGIFECTVQEAGTGEFHNAQLHVTDGNSLINVDSSEYGKESLVKTDTQDFLCTEVQQEVLFDGSCSSQSQVNSDKADSLQRSCQEVISLSTGTDTDTCNRVSDAGQLGAELQTKGEFEAVAELPNENQVQHDKVPENETNYLQPCATNVGKEFASIDESTVDTFVDITDIPEVKEFERNISESVLEIKSDDSFTTLVNESNNLPTTTTIHEKSESYANVLSEQLPECVPPHEHSKKEVPSSNEDINIDAQCYQKEIQAQNVSLIFDGQTDATVCQNIKCTLNNGGTAENSINHKSFKDLKVTEAVKRWIRDVTPEKAFTLSKEIQTLLLAEQDILGEMDTEDEYIEDGISADNKSIIVMESKNVKGNPFVAASSEAPVLGMDSCSKRVAVLNRIQGTTPDSLEEYDGASTISNLSYDHLYSEASSSHPASISHSFDDDEGDRLIENPDMYNPSAYTKYYQLGVELDDTLIPVSPVNDQRSSGSTLIAQDKSDNISECGSEDVETIPHKYDVVALPSDTSPMSLATEILKAKKLLNNMAHIAGVQQDMAMAEQHFGNPDIYLKHYNAAARGEVGDSGVQSEESSDETEACSNISSSGVGSSLTSTPAISPAHQLSGRPPLQSYPLQNVSVREGPVPCKTVCCAVM